MAGEQITLATFTIDGQPAFTAIDELMQAMRGLQAVTDGMVKSLSAVNTAIATAFQTMQDAAASTQELVQAEQELTTASTDSATAVQSTSASLKEEITFTQDMVASMQEATTATKEMGTVSQQAAEEGVTALDQWYFATDNLVKELYLATETAAEFGAGLIQAFQDGLISAEDLAFTLEMLKQDISTGIVTEDEFKLIAEAVSQALKDQATAAQDAANSEQALSSATQEVTSRMEQANAVIQDDIATLREYGVAVQDGASATQAIIEANRAYSQSAQQAAIDAANLAKVQGMVSAAAGQQAIMLGGTNQEQLNFANSQLKSSQAAYQNALGLGATVDQLLPLNRAVNEADARVQKYSAAVDEENAATGRANNSGGQHAFLLLMIAGAALQAARSFVDLGIQVDQSLTTLQAMTGSSAQQVDAWRGQLEQLAISTGQDLTKVVDAFYMISSSGFKASEQMGIMTVAAQLARAGNADLMATTDALVVSLKAYGAGASQAGTYADIMIKAAIAGNQTFSEFAANMAVVEVRAAAAGISFKDVATAESTLSLTFHDGSQAARDLNALLVNLGGDSAAVAAKAMGLGESFNAVKFQTLDWAGKLEYLNTFVSGNTAELTKLLGGTQQVDAAMQNLNLTTPGVAAEALHLGLSFDATKFASMDLVHQLQYLLDISGGNESRFKTLVGGSDALNKAFQDVNLSTSQVAKQAKSMGLEFDSAKYASDNLEQRLKMLWDMTGHNTNEFTKLVGGTYAAKAALALLADQGQNYNGVAQKMKDTTGALDQAFATAMQSIGAKGASAHAALQKVSEEFLLMIKPELTAFLTNVTNDLDTMAQHMNIVMPVIAGFATLIGGSLVTALSSMAAGLFAEGGALAALTGPVGWVVGGIALLAAGGVALAQNWQAVSNAFSFLGPVLSAAGGFFQTLWGIIVQVAGIIGATLQPELASLQTAWANLGGSLNQLGAALAPILPLLQMIAQGIGLTLLTMLGVLIAEFAAVATLIVTFFTGVATAVGGVIQIITGVVMAFVGVFTMIWGLIQGIFTHNWSTLQSGWHTFLQALVSAAQGFGNLLIGVIQGIVVSIVNAVLAFVGTIGSYFTNMWSYITTGHAAATAKVTASTQKMSQDSQKATQQMAQGMTQSLATLSDTASRLMQQAGGTIAKSAQTADQLTIGYWNDVASYVDKKAKELEANTIRATDRMKVGMQKNFQDSSDTAKSTMTQTATQVPALLSNMSTQATNEVQTMGKDISNAFDTVQTDAGSKVQAMVSDVNTKLSTMHTGAKGAADLIKKDLLADWTQVAADAKTQFVALATNISSELTTAKTDATTISAGIVSTLSSAWGLATTQAFTGGVNVGSSLAAGLNSQAGVVANAAANLATQISNNLPHSPAKEGPLMHADQFMPNFVRMLAEGMIANVSELRRASALAAGAIGGGVSIPLQATVASASIGSSGGGSVTTSTMERLLSQILAELQQQRGSGGAITNNTAINLNNPQTIAQLWQALNTYSGRVNEAGARGTFAGFGV